MTILVISNLYPGYKQAGALKMLIYLQKRLLFTGQTMFCANLSLRICWPALKRYDLISLVQKEPYHSRGGSLERDEVALHLPGRLVTMPKNNLSSGLNSTSIHV